MLAEVVSYFFSLIISWLNLLFFWWRMGRRANFESRNDMMSVWLTRPKSGSSKNDEPRATMGDIPLLRFHRRLRTEWKNGSSKLDELRATMKAMDALFRTSYVVKLSFRTKEWQQRVWRASRHDWSQSCFIGHLRLLHYVWTTQKNIRNKLNELPTTMQAMTVFFPYLRHHLCRRCTRQKSGNRKLDELCATIEVTAAFFRTCVFVIVLVHDKKTEATNWMSFTPWCKLWQFFSVPASSSPSSLSRTNMRQQ